MCGIFGIVDRVSPKGIDDSVLQQMTWLGRHRGPDELGLYRDDFAGLGHARLSIVDPAGGSQPMSNEDGSRWIVYNGETYNHLELRPDLERRGHCLRTTCDTKVVLHLYEEYGPSCLEHMNGQFAFAIWDRPERRLFMARDRFGVRPLYYTLVGDRLLFASEVKSLLAAPEARFEIDPIGLDQTFTFWSPLPPRTAFKGIRQLPAGHYLIAAPERTYTHRYWTLDFPPKEAQEERSKEYYVERLRDELVRATRLRMRADVPVAAYLSGGLDSSLTTAIVKTYTDAPLSTFSIRFQDARYDEGRHQNAMVNHLDTSHQSIEVGYEDIARAFAEVIWHTEAPILRTAPVPLHYLSGLVRRHGIKVVITGEGADEVLAGYDIFKEAKIRRFWAKHPGSTLRPLLLTRLYPYIYPPGNHRGDVYWQRFFAKDLTVTDDPCYSHRIRWGNTAALKRFFSLAFREQIGDYDGITEYMELLPSGFETWAPLSKAQYIEITTFLTGYLLSSQGDRVSMSHSVEGRYPFLDHYVAEFATQIPPKYKLRVLEEKHVLREMARGLLPDAVRQRPKQPYRAPDSASFSCECGQELIQSTLSPEAVREAGCFDPHMVARLVGKWRTARPATISAREDMALVALLSTQLLHQQFRKDTLKRMSVFDRPFRVYTPAQGHRMTSVYTPKC